MLTAALATAGRRVSERWIRVAHALQCMPPTSSSAVVSTTSSGPAGWTSSVGAVSTAGGPVLAQWCGRVAGTGDGLGQVVHTQLGGVVLDAGPALVEVDRDGLHPDLFGEHLLDEGGT